VVPRFNASSDRRFEKRLTFLAFFSIARANEQNGIP
jgi:hypothetical protein